MKLSPLDRWLTTDPRDKEQEQYEALEREKEMTYLQELTQECDYCEAMKGEACSPKCKKEEENK